MTSTTSTGGNSNPPTFPDECLFDGTNYITFKDQVLLAVRLRGAEGYLNGTIPAPMPKTILPTPALTEWWDSTPSHQEWQIRNAWALALIVYNTKNPIRLGIKMSDTAAKVWATLKEAYGTVSDLGANSAENSLRAAKYSDGMDFQEHIVNLRSKWNITVEKGADLKDNQFKAIVISSLSASWDYIVVSLQSTKTSIELIAGLNVHWEWLKEQSVSAGSTSTALLTKMPQLQRKLVCTNSNSGCTGHTIKNCYWKGGGKEGQFPLNFGRRRNAAPSQTNSQPPAVNVVTTENPTPQMTYALMADANFAPAAVYDLDLKPLELYLSSMEISTSVFALFGMGGEVLTYVDSGVTDYSFVKRMEFELYQAYTTP